MASLQRRMLSQDEEASIDGADLEVRREDQDKINKFSRLHQKDEILQEKLKTKLVRHDYEDEGTMLKGRRQKDKEDLEEVSSELELADDDEKVPYKIGDTFISLPVSEVQELLSSSTDSLGDAISKLEDQSGLIRDEMEQLKVQLYARFGKSINLET